MKIIAQNKGKLLMQVTCGISMHWLHQIPIDRVCQAWQCCCCICIGIHSSGQSLLAGLDRHQSAYIALQFCEVWSILIRKLCRSWNQFLLVWYWSLYKLGARITFCVWDTKMFFPSMFGAFCACVSVCEREKREIKEYLKLPNMWIPI